MATSTPLLPSHRRADDPAPEPRAASFRLPLSVVAAIFFTTVLFVVQVRKTWGYGSHVWTAYFSCCYLLIVVHFIVIECMAQFPHRKAAVVAAWRIFVLSVAGIFAATVFKIYYM